MFSISETLSFKVTKPMLFVHVVHAIPQFYVYVTPLYGYNKINVLSIS